MRKTVTIGRPARLLAPILSLALIRWTMSLASASLLALAPAALAQLPDELRTGQIRFQLSVDEPLAALALNPDPATDEQRLLHARALLELGLDRPAREALEAISTGDRSIAGQAGLELVRLAFETDDLEQASDRLGRLLPQLQGDQRQEGLFWQAELMRRRGDLAGAATTLDSMQNNPWSGLGYFNLATAYAEHEPSVSRSLITFRVAAATAGDDESQAGADIANRSHLAGGMLAMQEADFAKAAGFLAKVHLDSYQAPGALYLHGLSLLKQGHVHGALQSWQQALEFPIAFPGIAESYVAMGQAFEQAGANNQAANAFLSASAAFAEEQLILDELDQNVQQQGSYAALILANQQRKAGWFLDNSEPGMASRLAWLMRFTETADAQQAIRRLAELDRLDQRLQHREADLKVMRRSLEDRLEDLGRVSRVELGDSGAGRLQKVEKELRRRSEALQHRYERALAENPGDVHLAGEQSDRFRRLAFLQDAADHHGDPGLQERVRRLHGLTLWQAQESFGRDRDALAASLANLQKQMDEASTALQRFGGDVDEARIQFRALLARVEDAAGEVAGQRQRISALQQRSDQALADRARTFLADQKDRLKLLADRSEQHIAHLYEHLAVSRLKPMQPGSEAR